MSYNMTMHSLHYSDDLEYRTCLRQIFNMVNRTENEHDIDAITHDENDYDESAASKAMDSIRDQTKDNIHFQNLYDVAASKMLSTDREIGLAVLFSYDYMAMFHECYISFCENPTSFDENNKAYCALDVKIR